MKNIKLILGIIGGLILIVIVVGIIRSKSTPPQDFIILGKNIVPEVFNTSYTISKEVFALQNGRAENEIPNSTAKDTLTIFGEPVYGDLNNDGNKDAAVLLVNTTGESGTFFYAAFAIKDDTSYKATNSILLGDRIAPQTVEIQDGRAVYNFTERKIDEPISAVPSIDKSVWVSYDAKTNEISGK